ncbi:hypothetical protein AVEN_269258-1 [Araneus ventricosus]|uniref:Uncharacterized protein n=1 Tax=Araneus ventricosus TaxID=182803 RepID=A0A4Y2J749_ARAVE|nr:hypothetical protein AVEN_269258-1 [Araneus ventricosus]
MESAVGNPRRYGTRRRADDTERKRVGESERSSLRVKTMFKSSPTALHHLVPVVLSIAVLIPSSQGKACLLAIFQTAGNSESLVGKGSLTCKICEAVFLLVSLRKLRQNRKGIGDILL